MCGKSRFSPDYHSAALKKKHVRQHDVLIHIKRCPNVPIAMRGTVSIIMFFAFMLAPSAARSQAVTYDDIYGCIRVGRLDNAAGLLEKYIRLNPDSLNAYMLLGRVYMAIGGPNAHTAAERTLRAGLRREIDNAEFLRLLADVKEAQDMPALSIRWLERAVESDPAHQETAREAKRKWKNCGGL